MFLSEVGSALSTVTSLAIYLEDTCGRAASAAELDVVLAMLFSNLPFLVAFTCEGHLSVDLFRHLGQISPHLASLTLISGRGDNAYIQKVIALQPSLLPGINSLTLRHLYPDFTIPDMSGSTSIIHLALPRIGMDSVEWRCLPRKLEHLSCGWINDVPPASSDGTHILARLERLAMDDDGSNNPDMPLEALAEILRAATALKALTIGSESNASIFTVSCKFFDSTSSDLLLVQQNMAVLSFKTIIFRIDCTGQGMRAPARDVISTFPRMVGVAQCEFYHPSHGKLVGLLEAFPDVQHLLLTGYHEMGQDGVELRELAACSRLTHLELEDCNEVSRVGLLRLCQRLPTLNSVSCRRCAQLTEPVMRKCEEWLQSLGRLVKMTADSSNPAMIPIHQ